MIFTGDCREVMAEFEPDSIDAIVCDPPYDLVSIGKRFSKPDAAPVIDTFGGQYARLAKGFMGKAWDGTGVAFDTKTWEEAYRIAKPGAYLLAFGGTRTYHRMTVAIEDAGWEIRDCLVWAYASGFPKSHNLDGDREGWGTALKPAWEPIVMARKPLAGTVAGNVLKYGTGAINIDGTRIEYVNETPPDLEHWRQTSGGWKNTSTAGVVPNDNTKGRWPANVILTDPIFDGDVEGVEGGGETSSGSRSGDYENHGYMEGWGNVKRKLVGDSGTYSRFFLIPKASRADREPILGELPLQAAGTYDQRPSGNRKISARPDSPNAQRANDHPTVKPLELMRHLVRLVTPPGGTVLDPFAGSGTTLLAAQAEGFEWIGIELDPHYVEICEARLNGAPRGMGL
jgi:site-specific DNA-methyltransferase (adenine-specific)